VSLKLAISPPIPPAEKRGKQSPPQQHLIVQRQTKAQCDRERPRYTILWSERDKWAVKLLIIVTAMSSSSGTPESWISSFCSLLGHEYFAEISEEFIEDDFNLTGLQTQVGMYKEALEVCSIPPRDNPHH
jgi:hypothetical protein